MNLAQLFSVHNQMKPSARFLSSNLPGANSVTRRSFLASTLKTGALLLAPTIVPASVLGRNGTAPPSERIRLGAIGIGNRGSYVLGCFLEEKDVQFVAIAM